MGTDTLAPNPGVAEAVIVCIEQARRMEFYDREGDDHRYSFVPVRVPPHGYGQRGKYDIPQSVTDRNGKPRCRWCLGKIEPPRRSWCSDRCVDEYLLRADWNRIRQSIIERDRVCQFCGGGGWVPNCWRRGLIDKLDECPVGDLAELDGEKQFGSRFARHCSLRQEFEVDHIIAIADGGNDDPINLRLLCVPCHKRRTKLWHQQRAEANHGQLSFLEPAR